MKKTNSVKKNIGIIAFALVAIISALTLIVGLGTKAFRSKTINNTNYKDDSVQAEWPSNPEPKKTISSNFDGTYTLSLDVTGDADTVVPEPPRVNVLVVFDNSNSMNTFGAEYEESERGRFGNVDGEYFVLYRDTRGNEVGEGTATPAGTIYYRDGAYPNYDYHEYTNGTRYTKLRSRADAAEKVVYDFTTSLFSYQDKGGDETNIQMSLVTFNRNTTLVSDWTSNEDNITRRLSKTGASGSAGLGHNSGTNYEAALQTALEQLGKADGDQTFVIFVTDGAPSQYVGMPATPEYLIPEYCYGHSQDEALQIATYDTTTHTSNAETSNTTLYGIYAYGDEADYLDDVIYYALYNGAARDPETEETDLTGVSEYYFNASNTASLTSAMSHIFDKIVETFGVKDVEIQDGTTDQVKTSTEEVSHLLEVDTSSFKYWLTIPLIDNKFTRIDSSNGETIEYTVVANNNGTATVTWTGHSVTVNGSVSVGKLTYEWTEANDLYPKNPPTATYSSTTSKVDWDLSEVGTLLNDVTYRVTFVVYPSQEYNDTIADLKNGYLDYVLPGDIDPRPTIPNLDSELTKYILKDSNGEYTLKTNTGATVSWKDTRNEENPDQEYTYTYTPPDPVQTEPDQINIIKQWENDYDAKQVGPIDIGVNKDGKRYTTVTLEEANKWQEGPINIAAGLMRVHRGADGKITSTEILTSGHDFTFEELGEESYNWEMIAQTIHPMSINGTLRELVLVNDQVQNIYTLTSNPIAVPSIPSGMASTDMFYEETVTTTDDEGAQHTETHTFFRLEANSDKIYYLVPLPETTTSETTETGDATVGEDGETPAAVTHQTPTIRAYNYRRSNLNVQKIVDGDSADPDDLFEFTINVTDAGLTENEELWFSVYKGDYIDLTPEEGESRITGTAWVEKKDIIYKENAQGAQDPALGIDHIEYYYHAPKGTPLVVKLKADENLRFTNLTTQATFTVVESDKPSNYNYKPATEKSFDAWYGKGTTLHHITEEDYIKWNTIKDDNGNEIGISGEITVTNSSFYVYIENTYELVDVDVEKEWKDNDDQDGIRPDSVEVSLLADGEQAYVTSTTCEPETEGAEAPATCQVPAKVTLNEQNQWKYSFTGLPRHNNGTEIEYTVVETAIPLVEGHTTGYTTEYKDLRETQEVVDQETGATSTNITTVGKFIYKVVNTHIPEVTETSVKKEWVDNNDQDGIRPTSVTVHLLADKEQAYVTSTTCEPETEGAEAPATCQVEATVALNDSNSWTYTYSNLPKYKAGEEIEYTWSEDDIVYPSTGFTNGYVATQSTNEQTGLVTITNTHIPEVTTSTVTKVWDDDDDRDKARPTTLVMTLYDDRDQIVTFKDANNNNQSTVTLNAEVDWTATVDNLPKYRVDTAEDGTKTRTTIEYHWTETVPANYTKTSESSSNNATRITNYHEVQKTTVSVLKVWDDDDNRDNKRPTSVTVSLKANGNTAYQVVNNQATQAVQPITLNSSNNWTATVENLPLNENGTAISYTWVEDPVPTDYTATQETNNTTKLTTITNTYTPEKTEVSVEKIWNDNNNQDGIRPTSVTVNLKANGQTAKVYSNNCPVAEGETEAPATCLVNVEPITLNSSNSWKATVSNLPLNENGTAISYTWTEDDIEVPEGHATGYTAAQETNANTKVTTITNTHTPETVEAQVEKVWDDEDNRDGVRPTSLTVTLNNNKNVTLTTNTVTLNSNNSWKDSISNLPKYSNGEVITYTWDEGTLPDGYTLTTSTDETGLITTLTNTYVPEKTTATVIKVWDDEDNRDGIQPESVTVYLKANGNTAKAYSNNCPVAEGETEAPATCLVNVDAITLSASNKWTATVENLPLKENGQAIEYTWTEDPVPTNYKVTSSVDETGLITTLTNTHTPTETEVSVKKVWSDNNNQDGIRPTSVTVNLKANGKAAKAYSTECQVAEGETEAPATCLVNVDAITLSASNNWTATVSNLPLKENGTDISYTWTEDDIEVPAGHATGYTATQETNAETKLTTITNTHTPEKTTATVKKIWDDANNQDGIRPTSLTVTLSNGSTATLNAANGWEATISDLPKYANGVEIEYTWTEGTLPTGYELTNTAKNGTITSLTNSHTPATITAEVVKVWEDNKNQDGVRPTSLTVTLSNNKGVTLTTNTVTLSEDNDWSGKITGLPKKSNGEDITYTWTEGTLPKGYTLTSNETETTTTGYITTLENTYNPQTIDITVKKVWEDNKNQDGLRGDVTFVLTGTETNSNYSKTYTKTLTLTEQATSLQYVWQGLPVYNEGTKITYTLDETAYPEGYGKVVAKGSTDYEFVVTNTHTPATTEATVKKVWNDAGNQDGIRPTSLTVTLSNDKGVTLETNTVTLTAANGWTDKLTGLPAKADGEDITYTWTEDEESLPEGYELTGNSKEGTVTTLTNTYSPETTQATVKKVWDDDKDRDRKRPTELTVTLSNNKNVELEKTTVTLTEANGWSGTITGLPKKSNGEVITYTWTEGSMPSGYSLTDTSVEGTITTLTNSYSPEQVAIKATKVWDDDSNRDNIQPESVLITLLANGVSTGISKEANADNEWTVEFDKLNKYADGVEVEYSVTELEENVPAGYTVAVTGSAKDGFTVTNTHEPEVTERKITKIWEDEDNHDGMRPESIELVLKGDGKVVDVEPVITKEGNKWYFTYSKLPKFNKGVEIKYTIEEKPVDNYQGVVDGYTITNTHKPEKMRIDGTKTWYDNNDQDGIRPTEIKIDLYADDVYKDTVTVKAQEGNVWKYSFEDLDVYKNVNNKPVKIKYTVDEQDITVPEGHTGYTKEIKEYAISNTHDPATKTISGTKSWDDDNNRDGIRPGSVTINLLADGEPAKYSDGKAVEPVTTNADKNWEYKFENLPLYKDGSPITYSITEDDVEGYSPTLTSNGDVIDIKNTHEIERIKISGTKTWDDEDDQDGKRPESIEFSLLVDGQPATDEKGNAIPSVTTTADKGWAWEFDNLPKNANGVAIEYEVIEKEIKEYDSDVHQVKDYEYEVTNTHIPEKVTYTVLKTWEDDTNRDGKRPASIMVHLLANGSVKETVELSDENEWKHTFDNLPKYAKGVAIEYAITEDEIPDYDPSSTTKTVDNVTSVTLINTHIPERTKVEGTKTWAEDQNYLDRRPDYVTVKLFANGVYFDTIIVRKEDDWKYSVTNLYKYSEGVEIKYTIEEEAVEGYVTEYSGYDIINTFTDGEGCTDCNPPKTIIDPTRYDHYNILVMLIVGSAAVSIKRKYA